MTTVAQLKQFLEKNFKDDEQIFVAIDDLSEFSCVLYTDTEVIEKANDLGGYYDEDTDDEITDIDTAIQYLAEMDCERRYLEIEV